MATEKNNQTIFFFNSSWLIVIIETKLQPYLCVAKKLVHIQFNATAALLCMTKKKCWGWEMRNFKETNTVSVIFQSCLILEI